MKMSLKNFELIFYWLTSNCKSNRERQKSMWFTPFRIISRTRRLIGCRRCRRWRWHVLAVDRSFGDVVGDILECIHCQSGMASDRHLVLHWWRNKRHSKKPFWLKYPDVAHCYSHFYLHFTFATENPQLSGRSSGVPYQAHMHEYLRYIHTIQSKWNII